MSTEIVVNEENKWRLQTPGAQGWKGSAHAGAPNKYLMISADTHVQEPPTLWAERIEPKYRDRLPKQWVDDKGVRWVQSEGAEKPNRLAPMELKDEDLTRSRAGADPKQRIEDNRMDGVDGEIVFPNKGLAMWWTPDPQFAMAQCRVYNDWLWETFGPYIDRISPAAALATGDIEGSLAEVQRIARMGLRHVTLPAKPMFGAHKTGELNYNSDAFDRLWAAIQDADLPVTFHVSTGQDPRVARGPGGAVVNYVIHSLAPTVEPMTHLCAAGVVERFPKLRFGTVEAGIGWLAWWLDAMDESYRKHHYWVRPKLKALPSDYFRSNGFATFQEDQAGLDLVEKHGLVDNVMWANDYPHGEGTWPHSAQAIERTMGHLTEASRAKILGLNAAKVFKFDKLKPNA